MPPPIPQEEVKLLRKDKGALEDNVIRLRGENQQLKAKLGSPQVEGVFVCTGEPEWFLGSD